MLTKPEVFIVESLRFEDEEKDKFEGKMISHILNLHGKKSRYYYIRTKKELVSVIRKLGSSQYRYLHLSCHGNESTMATTLDDVSFKELGAMLNPFLKKKRVFVSACEMVNDDLARAIIPPSGCYSVIGPTEPVEFSDAAIFWSSFYHLMFSYNTEAMKRQGLLDHIQKISSLFKIAISYYSISSGSKAGYNASHFTN